MDERRQSSLTEQDRKEIADLFEERIKKMASDGAFIGPIWRSGYDTMSAHGIDAMSLWLGRKILYFLVTVAISATMAWALFFKGGK